MKELNKIMVPAALHGLIPYAERYGIADDDARRRILEASASVDLMAFKAVVLANDDALDLWLAGDEANGPSFSDEYVAFSAMRMAADTI